MALNFSRLTGPYPAGTSNSAPAFRGVTQAGAGLERLISSIAPFMSLIPGVGDSPMWGNMQSRAEGRRMTEVLERNRPNLARVDPNRSIRLNLPGGATNTGLQDIAQQAIREREDTLSALTRLGVEQQSVTADTRTALKATSQDVTKLKEALSRMTPMALSAFNSSIQTAKELKKQATQMMHFGIKTAFDLYNEVKRDQSVIREGFTNEVAGRASALATGIDAQANAGYSEHLRAVEGATGSMSSEERAALRSVYDRTASRDKADVLGRLYEVTSEVRAQLDTQLNASLTKAAESTVYGVGTSIATGMEVNTRAEQLIGELQTNKINALNNINMTQVNLTELSKSLALDGGTRLFEMVTNTVRPVAVFSDIMQNTFDGLWDVIAFNNNLDIQELSNELVIQNPMHQGVFEGLGVMERNRQLEAQTEAAHEQAQASMWGGAMSMVGNVAGGFAGNPSLFGSK